MKNHYGFVAPTITHEHFVLGAGQVPQVVLQENRDWTDHLPESETQDLFNLMTYNCTSFGTLNAVEILFKRVYGEVLNFSDRDLGIKSGTVPPGNDPHIVAEALRKKGVVPESVLPWTEDINTLEKYYSYGSKEAECKTESEIFLSKYVVKHEWVWDRHTLPLATKQERLYEALQYSPVGVSVYAWNKSGNYYVKNGEFDNHWVVVVKAEKGKCWHILDQYDPFIKKLDWDYDFGFAKRYHVEENTEDEQKIYFLQTILDLFAKIFPFLQKKEAEKPIIPPQPVEVKPVPKMTNLEKMYQAAKNSLGKEITPNDVAPDEYACMETVDTVKKLATGSYIAGKYPTVSTAVGYKLLKGSPEFQEVYMPEKGCIIISPTGYGNGTIANGHVGIVGIYGILSNDSRTGTFEENFTLESWTRYYKNKGGFPIHYFKLR